MSIRHIAMLIGGLWFAFSGSCWAQNDDDALKRSYQQAKKSVVADYSPAENGLNDDPRAPAALERAWTLIGQWASDYLNAHPKSTAGEFRQGMLQLDPGFSQTQLLRLGNDSWLVGVEWQDDILGGNIFIVGPRAGQLAALWNLRVVKPIKPAWDKLALARSMRAAMWDCYGNDCASRQVMAGVLSDLASGVHRFFVRGFTPSDANYRQRSEITIWQWDGEVATPVFAKGYTWMTQVDDPNPTFDGRFLRIEVMDEFKSFGSGRPYQDRDVVWSLEVTPSGVRDEGVIPKIGEPDLLDKLFDRLQAKLPTADIASPEVAASMTNLMALPAYVGERMRLGDRTIRDFDHHTKLLCIAFPPSRPVIQVGKNFVMTADRTYHFTITLAGGKEFLSSVEEHDDRQCTATVPRADAQWSNGSLEQAYALTSRVSLPQYDDAGSDINPDAIDILNRKWSIVQQWIVNYLSAHQWEGDVDLKPALRGLSWDYSSSVLGFAELDKDTYLIGPTPNYRNIGTAFVVKCVSGQFRIVWNVPAKAGVAVKFAAGTKSYLGPWTAHDDLQALAPDGIAFIGKLPDTAHGDHRFYLDTNTHVEGGADEPSQFTIWRWRGNAATLELAMDRNSNDSTPVPHVEGRYLHVPTRTEFKAISVDAQEYARPLDRLIYLGPVSVRYAGSSELRPEIASIDDLLDRMSHNEDASSLAARQVTAVLRPLVADARRSAKNGLFFEMDGDDIRHAGKNTLACTKLNFSGAFGGENPIDHTLQFTLRPVKGRFYATKVKDLAGAECGNDPVAPY